MMLETYMMSHFEATVELNLETLSIMWAPQIQCFSYDGEILGNLCLHLLVLKTIEIISLNFTIR